MLVLLGGDAAQWQKWAEARQWKFLAPWANTTEPSIDLRIKALEKTLAEMRATVDESRIYLAGQGEAAAAVFYVASRDPTLWAAAAAIGGSPRAAIDSNRVFGANTTNLPVLWIYGDKEGTHLAERLKSSGYNLEARLAPAAKPEEVFDWFAQHQLEPFPEVVDCETGVTAFPRCYWITVLKYDASERNDVLSSTRVPPVGSGATLDLGVFGINTADTGPGALVSFLPKDYQGPLKLNDRIVEIAGKSIATAAGYARLMDETNEEKPVAVMIQRGKDRVRVESRIVPGKREETVTARVQGRYVTDPKAVEIISRGVERTRVTVPDAWTPVPLSWNGTDAARADAPGCWELYTEKELVKATRCP